MNRKLYEILIKWLKEAGYQINPAKFEISLLSHPEYDRLTAITDTFTEFSIDHTAAYVPFEALPGLTEPFVAFIKRGYQEQFALIYPLDERNVKLFLGEKHTIIISIEEFKSLWTGTIVAIEKKELTMSFSLKSYSYILVAISTIILVLFVCLHPSLYVLIHFCLALVGLFISGLIVNHQLGYSNGISSKFCSLTKNTDCESVLNSKAAKLTTKIGLSDIGIVYFASQLLLYLLFASFTMSGNALLFTISLSVLPFIGYSIYQQKFVIKKWCPLCLGVIGILLLQGVVAILAFSKSSQFLITLKISTLGLLVGGLVVFIWLLLLPLLKASKSLIALKTESLSFRRNYRLLLPYLQSQPNVSFKHNFKTIEIGNPSGNLKLILVTNPLCNSCIETHKILNQIIRTQNDLSVEMIFYVPSNINDPRTIIAGHFLSQSNIEAAKSIEEWYKSPNPQTFIKRFGDKVSADTFEILEQHKLWCHKNNIFMTATLIINSKRFPNFYNPTDIQYFIEELLSTSERISIKEVSNKVLVDNT